ncbi:hypothetical protein QBC35DRAFT_483714 [Podospora australis]|uniref:Uncharacterized protein n=1 Tax=Podospora australis TaxID=1536484 RepID=A0AAN6X307_9PEZI|nr:hypothetical protein QBC35DRAFT_483714 [Podospora australis]
MAGFGLLLLSSFLSVLLLACFGLLRSLMFTASSKQSCLSLCEWSTVYSYDLHGLYVSSPLGMGCGFFALPDTVLIEKDG